MMSINIIPKPSSNNAIYYSSKNNTRLSIPFINNDVNYCPSKRKNDVVAKMASHAIFQYNVLVIDIDNTTLGLI